MKKYLECSIYSAKITQNDYKEFFNNLTDRKVPLFGFLNLSNILTLNGITLIIKREGNTIKFFIEDKDDIYTHSSLLFPFRMSHPKELKLTKGTTIPRGMYLVPGGDMFDFLIKDNVKEIRVNIVKFLGHYYGFGTTITNDNTTKTTILLNPTKFFEIDLEKNPTFYIELLEPIPKLMNMQSENPIFKYDETRIGLDNFDAFQHTLLVGTSGSGKTKALEIMIKAIKKKYKDANILVIDPHNEVSKLFKDKGAYIVDYTNNYIEPLDTGEKDTPLKAQLVSQMITSTIGQENKYAERVVFYSVNLLASIKNVSLKNINLLLTDSTKRSEFSSMCENEEVRRFFDEEFSDIYMQHFNDAVLPVINFIGEYMLYLGGEKKLERIDDLMKKNRLTIVSFNPHQFGRRIIKFFAGSIINQMYIAAIEDNLERPTILIVDEFPIVENKIVSKILAETRKYGLYIYMSAQYINQLTKNTIDATMSNVRNVISFKVTREDAGILSSMMEIKVEEYFKKHSSPSELEQAKREMFINLHPRECIVRLFDGKNFLITMKVKTVHIDNWKDEIIPDNKQMPSTPKKNVFMDKK